MTHNVLDQHKEIERFLYICSHDLRKPLRTIANFMQLLIEHNTEKFDKTSSEYIQHILKRLTRIDTFIKNIQLYSFLSTQSKELCLVDMHHTLRIIHNHFMPHLEQAHAVIEIGNLPTLYANPAHMLQLFMNLIDNTIKFRNENPLIIRISAIDKHNMWEFSIADNGISIDKEFKNTIFNFFTRLDTLSDYEGSDMRLSICSKIVHMYQGTINVRPNKAGGCAVIVTFPKHEKQRIDSLSLNQTIEQP